jgi:hypothetical protein
VVLVAHRSFEMAIEPIRLDHQNPCTIPSTESYQTEIPLDCARVDSCLEALREVARRCGPIRIEYKGLTAGIAQGWPIGGTLYGLRRAFRRRATGIKAENTHRSAHASLITLAEPLRDLTSLVKLVERNRHAAYGLFAVHSAEIVSYEQEAFCANLLTLARVALKEDVT